MPGTRPESLGHTHGGEDQVAENLRVVLAWPTTGRLRSSGFFGLG